MDAMFPWPSRNQRKAAIRRARAEKERSRTSAAHAAQVETEIGRLAAQNHFAEAISRQIAQHRGPHLGS